MAHYRLEVKAIKRSDGRSAVAASAYRAAGKLFDERLEMVFDYTDKGGVAFTGILAPDAAPAELHNRERLWNAAEAADKRADSRTAREILVSLPHELSDDQRHALVRAFIAESLVGKGMIADYGIHYPDAHGDERNHHAHILVTTRRVGPEGFGFKAREWDNPDAVKALRLEWEQIQNLHLRQHLGQAAPQVTSRSLTDQGLDQEPTIHLGPAASGMERRGESSDRGDINRRVQTRNAERQTRPVQVRELEDQMAVGRPRQAYTIDAVIREFESIHQTMVRERDSWARAQARASAPVQTPTVRSVVSEVMGDTPSRRAQAARRLDWTRSRIEKGRARRQTLVRWVRNPARMIWAAHAELNALDRARAADRRAQVDFEVRQAWLRSETGQAYIASRLDRLRQAAADARREARTLERRIKRADRRIEAVARTRIKLLMARELGHESMVAPTRMDLGVGQAVREVDRRVVDVVKAHAPAAQERALSKVMALVRGKIPGIGLER